MRCVGQIMGLLCKALTYWWSTVQVYGRSVVIVLDLLMGCRQFGMGIVKNSDPISGGIEQLCKGLVT